MYIYIRTASRLFAHAHKSRQFQGKRLVILAVSANDAYALLNLNLSRANDILRWNIPSAFTRPRIADTTI